MRQIPTIMTIAICEMMLASLSYAGPPEETYVKESGDCDQCTHLRQAQLFSRQPGLLGDKLGQILPGRPNKIDLYFLGFAGNGDEPVFANEVRFAEKRIAERYSTDGRSAVLTSSIDNLDSQPLANTQNLFRSISDIGEKMDAEDDILFLFLSSHGWNDATLQVSLGDLPLKHLRGSDLRAALDAAGIRWRIIVISGCYTGSFIEPLKNRRTVVMTAASAQNVSYGCAPDNDLTDFGRALFEDAIGSSDGLLEDFRKARSIIAKREKLEALTPSRPQTYVGFDMDQKLNQLSNSF
jgi:hypothetical protein